MSSKLRIRFGAIEVEYEGEDSYLKTELPKLLATVTALHREAGAQHAEETNSASEKGSGSGALGGKDWSTSTFATKLNSKSGPTLIRAAMAHLRLAKGKAVVERKEILDAMKSATTYYKATYNNNLTKYLKSLVSDGKIHQAADGKYSIAEDDLKVMRSLGDK